MKNILVIGAGRSATVLINYLLENAVEHKWYIVIADFDRALAIKKVNGHPNGQGVWLDILKVNDRRDLIQKADVVVSLLPAHLHIEVAQDCILLKKHLITASYVSKEMYQLADEAKKHDLIFMGEMGLDPGIDHMSAMQKIDEIKAMGGTIKSFRSYTGGLVAPESDTNPWHYKFTWNPRNVILAGQGTAQYLEDNKFKYIPYNRLFNNPIPVQIDEMGEYEAYPNRDSLLYRSAYGLNDIPNILRGTLRYSGYSKAWHALVKLGLTDGTFPIVNSDELTYLQLVEAYLPIRNLDLPVKERMALFLDVPLHSEIMKKLEWIGLFTQKKIKLSSASPASILEEILLDKWKLEPTDIDMIIMQHEFEYEMGGKMKKLTSSMVLKGEDSEITAMAKCVGLPLGIFVKNVMLGNITSTGSHIPVKDAVYSPVLKELEEHGVIFKEREEDL